LSISLDQQLPYRLFVGRQRCCWQGFVENTLAGHSTTCVPCVPCAHCVTFSSAMILLLWSAVDPTLPSPLSCYGPLTSLPTSRLAGHVSTASSTSSQVRTLLSLLLLWPLLPLLLLLRLLLPLLLLLLLPLLLLLLVLTLPRAPHRREGFGWPRPSVSGTRARLLIAGGDDAGAAPGTAPGAAPCCSGCCSGCCC